MDKKGNIFQGDFSDGSLSGMGHMTCKNGDTYVGTFKNGLFDGKGQLTYSGNVYNGNFCEGKKKGEGLIIFENGDKYEVGRVAFIEEKYPQVKENIIKNYNSYDAVSKIKYSAFM